MNRRLLGAALLLPAMALPLAAQDPGTAGGKGTLSRMTGKTTPSGDAETVPVPFAPRFSYAYREGQGKNAFTWIVLTEKQPPLKEWLAAKDPAGDRQTWCAKDKASFTAVKLDAQMKMDLYYLCPADGSTNIEMQNTMNGLESVADKIESTDKRLKGTLKTGQGSCPGPNETQVYCTPTGDYTFDAPILK